MQNIITASTEIYGIIGNPAKHSKSPIIQNGWIKDEGINAIYCAFEPNNFEICFKGLIEAQIKGFNITAPFKEDVVKLCSDFSHDVKIMGAANTILNDDGKICAFNTDGEGLVLDLNNRAKNWRQNNSIITIIGAGGAAKGIIAALINNGVKQINIVARNIEKANDLILNAQNLQNTNNTLFKSYDWENISKACINSGLIINATTIGLKGNGNLEIDFSKISKNTIIYDMVYYPNETYFIKNAINNGNFTLNGMGMLVGQGALAFQKWFGILPDFDIGLKRMLENA